jgi:hypothetical protein
MRKRTARFVSYAASAAAVTMRSREQTSRFFDGLELVEPGLVYVAQWRPEGPSELFYDEPVSSGYYAGLGRKL